jgi:Fe-S oxidoreductase
LYDQKDKENMARLRVWDSCMLKGYARVAGGNPRPKLFMRLRNRFEKKFDFFPKVAGVYACTGCGRCVSACPAKIDIRKVLKRLVNNV